MCRSYGCFEWNDTWGVPYVYILGQPLKFFEVIA